MFERTRPDTRQMAVFTKCYTCQTEAGRERIIPDTRHSIRNLDACETATVFERTRPDARQLAVFTKSYACQFTATIKCAVPDARHTRWNIDACEFLTVRECTRPDTRQLAVFTKCYTCQFIATIKCTPPDTCHTRWNIDVCQTAPIERLIPDTRHRQVIVLRRNHNICIFACADSGNRIGFSVTIHLKLQTFTRLC